MSKSDTENIEENIRKIKGNLPKPRLNLSLNEKLKLIKSVGGPKTTKSILKAKGNFPISRIAWLFNALDTQAVIDILHNDMVEALNHTQKDSH
ncbi:MAG: hypothetical protein R3B45_03225 [Bdellovibrionota bacterium]